MFWLRNKKIFFQYALLSGDLLILHKNISRHEVIQSIITCIKTGSYLNDVTSAVTLVTM